MKNHTDGWDKAIAEVNARITNGVIVDLKSDETQSPARAGIASEPQRRDAIINNVCRSLGMLDAVPCFANDPRALPEILRSVYASKMRMEASKAALRMATGGR